jgi:hypothetical protein
VLADGGREALSHAGGGLKKRSLEILRFACGVVIAQILVLHESIGGETMAAIPNSAHSSCVLLHLPRAAQEAWRMPLVGPPTASGAGWDLARADRHEQLARRQNPHGFLMDGLRGRFSDEGGHGGELALEVLNASNVEIRH